MHREEAVCSHFAAVLSEGPGASLCWGSPARPRHAGECQHLASSWGPARADGIPAAAHGMGTHRRVKAQRSFGSSAALPRSM